MTPSTSLTRVHVLTRRPLRLALATVAIAAAGVLMIPAEAAAQPGGWGGHGSHAGPGGHGGGHGGGHRSGMGGHFSERLLDDVKATAEQKSQIRQIMDAARKDLSALRDSGRGLRDEAMRLFAQPNVDANAVEALRQKRLAQHDQASRRMSQAMVDASRVLTAEQRQQIAERMQKRGQMMERHRRERDALGGGRP
jgi:Spy/CpxP family protein refolding chaperone